MKINDEIIQIDWINLDDTLRADYKKTLDVMFNNWHDTPNFQMIEIINYLLNRYHAQTFPELGNGYLVDQFLLAFSQNIGYGILSINNRLEILPIIQYKEPVANSEVTILFGLKSKRFIQRKNDKLELVIFNIHNDLENEYLSIPVETLENYMIKVELHTKQVFTNFSQNKD